MKIKKKNIINIVKYKIFLIFLYKIIGEMNMKKSDLQELREGTIIYNNNEQLKFVEKGKQLYYFNDFVFDNDEDEGHFSSAHPRLLTKNEVLGYSIKNYGDIVRIRNDYRNNYENYVEEAYSFIQNVNQIKNLKEVYIPTTLEDWLIEKHPEWAQYQIDEIIEEVLDKIEEEYDY